MAKPTQFGGTTTTADVDEYAEQDPRYREFKAQAGRLGEGARLAGEDVSKFAEYTKKQPMAQWAGNAMDTVGSTLSPAMAAGTMIRDQARKYFGPIDASDPSKPVDKTAPPGGTPHMSPEQEQSISIAKSQRAGNAMDPLARGPASSGARGVGNGDLNGYGTEPRIIGGKEGMIQTKVREGAHRADEAQGMIDYANAEADTYRVIGDLKRRHYGDFKNVVEGLDKEQKNEEDQIHKLYNEAANKGVDPGRLYKNLNVGTGLAMSIGAVASGMLSALQGQAGNPFMDAVREHIRTDIAAQETDIEQGWKKAKGAETAYERMRIRGVDQVTASLKTYDMHLASLQSDIQGQLAKAKIPAYAANLKAGLEAVTMERQAMGVNLDEYAKNVRTQRAAAAAAAAERAYQRDLGERKFMLDVKKAQTEEQKVLLEHDAAMGKSGAAKQEALDKGFFATGVLSADQAKRLGLPESMVGRAHVGVSVGEEGKKKLQERAESHDAVMGAINRMKELRDKSGAVGRAYSKTGVGRATDFTGLTGDDRRALTQEAKAAVIALNHGEGLGAYDNGTAQILGKIIDEDVLNGIGTEAGDRALEELKVMADRKYRSRLNASGGTPAVNVYMNGKWQTLDVPAEQGGMNAPTGGSIGDLGRPLGR